MDVFNVRRFFGKACSALIDGQEFQGVQVDIGEPSRMADALNFIEVRGNDKFASAVQNMEMGHRFELTLRSGAESDSFIVTWQRAAASSVTLELLKRPAP